MTDVNTHFEKLLSDAKKQGSRDAAYKFVAWTTALPIILIVPLLLKGWVLSVLWRWFVVHQFHLAPLGVAEAIGISAIVGLLQVPPTSKTSGKKEEPSSTIAAAAPLLSLFLGPLFVLLIGWIVQMFL